MFNFWLSNPPIHTSSIRSEVTDASERPNHGHFLWTNRLQSSEIDENQPSRRKEISVESPWGAPAARLTISTGLC